MERTHRERKHVCRRLLFLFINEQRARIAAGTGNKMVNMIRTGGKLQRTCCKSVKERKTFQSPPGSSVTTSLTLPECEGCTCQSCSSGKRRKQDRKGTHRVRIMRYDEQYEKSNVAESRWNCRLPPNNNVTRNPLGKANLGNTGYNADTGTATHTTWTA